MNPLMTFTVIVPFAGKSAFDARPIGAEDTQAQRNRLLAT
jgi:hypothetical protein